MVRTLGNSDGVALSQPRVAGESTLPWVTGPTNLATLTELRLAVGVMCLMRFHTLLICNHKSLQKDLWLFRALPFASVCVVQYLESKLSTIPRHPHPRLPDGKLKSLKYKKPPLAVKKVRLTPVEKLITLFLI